MRNHEDKVANNRNEWVGKKVLFSKNEGEFGLGFVELEVVGAVCPSLVPKPREISRGAFPCCHCHGASPPSPPHHGTTLQLTVASHPQAACTLP